MNMFLLMEKKRQRKEAKARKKDTKKKKKRGFHGCASVCLFSYLFVSTDVSEYASYAQARITISRKFLPLLQLLLSLLHSASNFGFARAEFQPTHTLT
jgi:hypothetical protein